jgi:hypothetical protein
LEAFVGSDLAAMLLALVFLLETADGRKVSTPRQEKRRAEERTYTGLYFSNFFLTLCSFGSVNPLFANNIS